MIRLVSLLAVCAAMALPPVLNLPKKKKRLIAPNPHGAAQLMFAPAVIYVPTTNHFLFRYKTNAVAAFGWALESSTDLTNWFIRIYPVMTNDMWIVESKTNVKVFYRVRGRN